MSKTQVRNTAQSTGQMFQRAPSAQAPATTSGEGPQPGADNSVKNWMVSLNNSLTTGPQRARLEAMLPKGMDPERFVATCYWYIRTHEELWGLEKQKLMNEFFKVAQQGLDFGLPNECHIVRYAQNCSMIRGYKGDLKLVRRTPYIAFVDANEVYENDTFEVDLGAGSAPIHKLPKPKGPRGAVVGFYAAAKDRDGNFYLMVMDNDQVWRHARRFTKATKKGPFAGVVESGPAADNWIPYGLKTAIHQLCARKLDMTSEMANSFTQEWDAMRGGTTLTDTPIDVEEEEEPIRSSEEESEPAAEVEETKPEPAPVVEEVQQAAT